MYKIFHGFHLVEAYQDLKKAQFTLNSPGGNLQTTIIIGDQLTYDITCDGRQILAPSPIAMSLDNGDNHRPFLYSHKARKQPHQTGTDSQQSHPAH